NELWIYRDQLQGKRDKLKLALQCIRFIISHQDNLHIYLLVYFLLAVVIPFLKKPIPLLPVEVNTPKTVILKELIVIYYSKLLFPTLISPAPCSVKSGFDVAIHKFDEEFTINFAKLLGV